MFLLSSANVVFAYDSSANANSPYCQEFERILSAENRPISECASELNALFIQDPGEFLYALSLQNSDSQETIISLLLLANDIGAAEGFLERLEMLDSADNKTEAETAVIHRIYTVMDSWNEDQERLRPLAEGRYAFDMQTVRAMIDMNLEAESVDTDFFRIVANAFLTNPSLFSETVADLPQDDIQFLARAISYDLHKTGRTSLVKVPGGFATEAVSSTTHTILSEIGNSSNAVLSSFAPGTDLVQTQQTVLPRMVSDEAHIYLVSLSSTTAAVYSSVGATVYMGFDAGISNTRSYTIKIFKVSDTSETLITSKNISVSGGTSTQSQWISVPLNSIGTYPLRAKLYDSNGTLLAILTSASVTVKPRWKIQIILPIDRTNTGMLYLYDSYGELKLSCSCLGLSESGASPLVYEGNTPTGQSWAWLEGPHDGYGPGKVVALIEPISGDLLISGREGILIHGGSHIDPVLTYTDGCIRVSNVNQVRIQGFIESFAGYHNKGLVVIAEMVLD